MPPRLPLAQAARCCRAPIALSSTLSSTPSSLVSLFAALSVQTRSASILASLSDNRGAYNKRIRKGRGPSSGYGKTSGRGHNGQKQKGKIHPWFQGGQTPLIVSHGRKGFVNHLSTEMTVINIDKLQEWIDLGRIDATKPITPKELILSGIMGRTYKDGIKLLARGNEKLTTPINILVSRASASAIAAVEAAGGTVKTRYFTHKALQRLAAGESVCTDKPLPFGAEYVDEVVKAAMSTKDRMYRLPDPTGRWEMEYYRDPAHRGYLSHMVKPGQSPSLYFRVPTAKSVIIKSKSKKQLEQEMNPVLF